MQLISASRKYKESTVPLMQGQSDPPLEQGEKTRSPVSTRNAIDLFACHLEWRDRKLLPAYGELIAALHDLDPDIRLVAQTLLCRALVGSKGNVTANWRNSQVRS